MSKAVFLIVNLDFGNVQTGRKLISVSFNELPISK